MDLTENICVCCSMPSIDCLHMMNRRNIVLNTLPIRAIAAYDKCSGISSSQFPEPIKINPKICAVCLMQLEISYKFYDRCAQTRSSFDFANTKFSACRACSCPDYMEENELHDMEEKDFVNNRAVTKCIDAFFQFCGVPEKDRRSTEFYKICQTCLSHLENAFMFQTFCQHAFTILKRKYEKKKVIVHDTPPINIEPKEHDMLAITVKEEPPSYEQPDSGGDDHWQDVADYASDDSTNAKQEDKISKKVKKNKSDKERPKKAKLRRKEKRKRESSKIKDKRKLPKRPGKTKTTKNIKLEPQILLQTKVELPEVTDDDPTNVPSPFKCDICSTSYTHLRFLRMHMRRHIKDPNYRLTRIRKKPEKSREYRRLGQNCTNEREYRAELRMAKEQRIVVEGEPFVCDLCSSQFIKINTLRVHMEKKHIIVDDKQKHLCNECGALFSRKSKLDFHMEVHRETKHRCTLCSKSYTYEKDLKRHYFTHTGGRPGFSPCPICKKSLKTDSIDTHIKNVHVDRKHHCDKCDKKFVKKDELWCHQFEHLGYLPYNCPEVDQDGMLCDFATKKKQVFMIHLLKKHNISYTESVHGYNENRTDISRELHAEKAQILKKPSNYHCDKCDKGFLTMTGLYHHRRIDHLNVSFKCGFCGKDFTQKPALWSHSFVHRDFFPYNCEAYECTYQTRNKRSFQIHLKKDHDIMYKEDIHGYKKETFQQVIDIAMNIRLGQPLQYSGEFGSF